MGNAPMKTSTTIKAALKLGMEHALLRELEEKYQACQGDLEEIMSMEDVHRAVQKIGDHLVGHAVGVPMAASVAAVLGSVVCADASAMSKAKDGAKLRSVFNTLLPLVYGDKELFDAGENVPTKSSRSVTIDAIIAALSSQTLTDVVGDGDDDADVRDYLHANGLWPGEDDSSPSSCTLLDLVNHFRAEYARGVVHAKEHMTVNMAGRIADEIARASSRHLKTVIPTKVKLLAELLSAEMVRMAYSSSSSIGVDLLGELRHALGGGVALRCVVCVRAEGDGNEVSVSVAIDRDAQGGTAVRDVHIHSATETFAVLERDMRRCIADKGDREITLEVDVNTALEQLAAIATKCIEEGLHSLAVTDSGRLCTNTGGVVESVEFALETLTKSTQNLIKGADLSPLRAVAVVERLEAEFETVYLPAETAQSLETLVKAAKKLKTIESSPPEVAREGRRATRRHAAVTVEDAAKMWEQYDAAVRDAHAALQTAARQSTALLIGLRASSRLRHAVFATARTEVARAMEQHLEADEALRAVRLVPVSRDADAVDDANVDDREPAMCTLQSVVWDVLASALLHRDVLKVVSEAAVRCANTWSTAVSESSVVCDDGVECTPTRTREIPRWCLLQRLHHVGNRNTSATEHSALRCLASTLDRALFGFAEALLVDTASERLLAAQVVLASKQFDEREHEQHHTALCGQFTLAREFAVYLERIRHTVMLGVGARVERSDADQLAVLVNLIDNTFPMQAKGGELEGARGEGGEGGEGGDGNDAAMADADDRDAELEAFAELIEHECTTTAVDVKMSAPRATRRRKHQRSVHGSSGAAAVAAKRRRTHAQSRAPVMELEMETPESNGPGRIHESAARAPDGARELATQRSAPRPHSLARALHARLGGTAAEKKAKHELQILDAVEEHWRQWEGHHTRKAAAMRESADATESTLKRTRAQRAAATRKRDAAAKRAAAVAQGEARRAVSAAMQSSGRKLLHNAKTSTELGVEVDASVELWHYVPRGSWEAVSSVLHINPDAMLKRLSRELRRKVPAASAPNAPRHVRVDRFDVYELVRRWLALTVDRDDAHLTQRERAAVVWAMQPSATVRVVRRMKSDGANATRTRAAMVQMGVRKMFFLDAFRSDARTRNRLWRLVCGEYTAYTSIVTDGVAASVFVQRGEDVCESDDESDDGDGKRHGNGEGKLEATAVDDEQWKVRYLSDRDAACVHVDGRRHASELEREVLGLAEARLAQQAFEKHALCGGMHQGVAVVDMGKVNAFEVLVYADEQMANPYIEMGNLQREATKVGSRTDKDYAHLTTEERESCLADIRSKKMELAVMKSDVDGERSVDNPAVYKRRELRTHQVEKRSPGCSEPAPMSVDGPDAHAGAALRKTPLPCRRPAAFAPVEMAGHTPVDPNVQTRRIRVMECDYSVLDADEGVHVGATEDDFAVKTAFEMTTAMKKVEYDNMCGGKYRGDEMNHIRKQFALDTDPSTSVQRPGYSDGCIGAVRFLIALLRERDKLYGLLSHARVRELRLQGYMQQRKALDLVARVVTFGTLRPPVRTRYDDTKRGPGRAPIGTVLFGDWNGEHAPISVRKLAHVLRLAGVDVLAAAEWGTSFNCGTNECMYGGKLVTRDIAAAGGDGGGAASKKRIKRIVFADHDGLHGVAWGPHHRGHHTPVNDALACSKHVHLIKGELYKLEMSECDGRGVRLDADGRVVQGDVCGCDPLWASIRRAPTFGSPGRHLNRLRLWCKFCGAFHRRDANACRTMLFVFIHMAANGGIRPIPLKTKRRDVPSAEKVT